MEQFVADLQRWRIAASSNLRKRSWKAWLAVAGVSYILFEIVLAQVTDASALALVHLLRGIRWVTQQPMGLGGLFLLSTFALLALLSWLQSRPKRQSQIVLTPTLSAEERRLVQDLRTVWQRHGVLATDQLKSILDDTMREVKQTQYWAVLLDSVSNRLSELQSDLGKALDPSEKKGIGEVRASFNQTYHAYTAVMKWVALLEANEGLQLGPRGTQKLEVWRQNHRDFIERLKDLNTDPEHRGTLEIFFHWIDDPDFRRFHREAEVSPQWLALMQKSSGETDEGVPEQA